jgi:multimeric flavodoxin WrbA
MKIIGLNGSPNKNGNTKFLMNLVLQKCIERGAEIEIIEVSEIMAVLKNSFCIVCSNPCSGICYSGTKLEEAFNKLKKADAIVFGSPVYFGTISSQLKAFFDKSRKIRSEKGLYNKIGAGITTGTSKYGGQETTMRAMHDIMLVHGMMIIGDGYIDDDCGHHGVSGQRPANEDENAILRAEIIAKRIIEVCDSTMDLRGML